MILKKTIIDGKEIYEPINYEEALEYQNKDELIFTSDDEKEEFEEKIEEQEAKAKMQAPINKNFFIMAMLLFWFLV